MSRHLGTLFSIVVLMVLLAVALRQDPGYVLISWGTTSVELSLTLAALCWFLSLWVVVQIVLIERWFLRQWRRDWQGFFGLSARKKAKTAEKSSQPPSNA
ncbi:MAG: hypothetical protein AABY68_08165 [Pseudomonadota bacterium]